MSVLDIILGAIGRHGFEKARPTRRGVARTAMEWIRSSKSRYMPHQGPQEAERRLKQGRRSDFVAWQPHPSKRA